MEEIFRRSLGVGRTGQRWFATVKQITEKTRTEYLISDFPPFADNTRRPRLPLLLTVLFLYILANVMSSLRTLRTASNVCGELFTEFNCEADRPGGDFRRSMVTARFPRR